MELQRFTRLGRVTRDLSAATDLDTVTDIITRLVGDAVSASVTMLALRDGDDLVTLGLRGTPLVPELTAGRFPLSEPVPICDAILTGRPVLLLDNEELSAAYPNLAGSDTVAMLAFPLRSGEDQAFGALALWFVATGLGQTVQRRMAGGDASAIAAIHWIRTLVVIGLLVLMVWKPGE